MCDFKRTETSETWTEDISIKTSFRHPGLSLPLERWHHHTQKEMPAVSNVLCIAMLLLDGMKNYQQYLEKYKR